MARVMFTEDALRHLMLLPERQRKRIYAKIEQIAVTGLHGALANQVVKLQGRDGYRLRVGRFRVLFDYDEDSLLIVAVLPRGSAYR